jgi:hypothetical protein
MSLLFQTLFDEAETRYLKPEELREMGQYVASIPERVNIYRSLRDQELTLMQQVADQLQLEVFDAKTVDLERSLRFAIVSLRHCAMGLLLNDETVVQNRLLSWLEETIALHQNQAIDAVVFRLLGEQLEQTLTPQQMAALRPFWALVQAAIPAAAEEEEMLTVAGIF